MEVGEVKQDAPVGTTLALIEQNAKIIDSAHKRLHAAQAEEFKLLKCRFREDPESFWRHNKKTTIQWKKDQFIEALNKCELVPVADPNNPTALHRYAKGQIIKELQKGDPTLYDPIGVDTRVLLAWPINPEGLFVPRRPSRQILVWKLLRRKLLRKSVNPIFSYLRLRSRQPLRPRPLLTSSRTGLLVKRSRR
jgi:hypothetical protein